MLFKESRPVGGLPRPKPRAESARLLEATRERTMQGQVIEADRESAAPGQPQENEKQLDYIARYIWSVQQENKALRERIRLLLEAV